jgi:hypothetical protein
LYIILPFSSPGRHFVGVFAVASTLYVTVNFAPLNVWNATAVPTKGALPDGTGLDEGINWFGPIKVIATAPVGGLAISGTPWAASAVLTLV